MPEPVFPEVSELLAQWGAGDRDALRVLIPLLYQDLRLVAHRHLRKARAGHTLQTTALVHQAYLRLEQNHHARFRNRSHFVGICALLMRKSSSGRSVLGGQPSGEQAART